METVLKKKSLKSCIRFVSSSAKVFSSFPTSHCTPSKSLLSPTAIIANCLSGNSLKPGSLNQGPFSIKSSSCPITTSSVPEVLQHAERIYEFVDKNITSGIESKIKSFCHDYSSLDPEKKLEVLRSLACDHDVDHSAISKLIENVRSSKLSQNELSTFEIKARALLSPRYLSLFKAIGRSQNGVKFLVDLRLDILRLQSIVTAVFPESIQVRQLNAALKNLLSDWFNVGFLELQRVTWKSSCEMLQKISEYEAVHPMRSWTDLKRRVGPYRRCFAYTHFAMPNEPLVVLHTALCEHIASSTSEIFASSKKSMSYHSSESSHDEKEISDREENLNNVNTAIFYSISSTQPGLQGIELGNHLIKRVVRELQSELPQISQFSTLSPIPGFTMWLLGRFKFWESENWFPLEDIKPYLIKQNESAWTQLRQLFVTNSWYKEPALQSILKEPLLKLCAHYLYNEKKRGFALNSVANFHLKNGAVMWRINWLADVSPRGLSNSCGIMVNYRYFLAEAETNSQNYVSNQVIPVSESVLKLANDKYLVSKM